MSTYYEQQQHQQNVHWAKKVVGEREMRAFTAKMIKENNPCGVGRVDTVYLIPDNSPRQMIKPG